MATSSRSESSIEASCCKHALKHKVTSIKLSHGRTGEPDRIFLLPSGGAWLVEFKAEDGRLSPRQELVFGAYGALGHPVTVVDSVDQFRRELKKRLTV